MRNNMPSNIFETSKKFFLKEISFPPPKTTEKITKSFKSLGK